MLPVECRPVFITSTLDFVLRRWLLIFGIGFLAGCEAEPESAISASAPVQSDAYQQGELLSYACEACHSLGAGGAHQVGPNLYGVFGRVAGSAESFVYSTALLDSGIIWSAAELDRWLADPVGFLPGTTMAFTGYQSSEDRQVLIEFLIAATGP